MNYLNIKNKMAFIVAILFSLTAIAQDGAGKGSIYGAVAGEDQNDVLPGASIIIKSLNLGAATDFDGIFRISSVAPGNYTLEISYLGYTTKKVEVVLKPNENLNVGRIILKPSTNELGEIIVSASIEGQQRAYNKQKNSDQIKTVVSADLVNQFPDINVGEALQRVTGVNIERNNGEGSNIRIRGTPRNYTAVTIDGATLATTDPGGDRTEALDLIPAELLASMEITKALLPENDGDAIGGAVNLITPTATSQKGRIKGTVAGGVQTIFDRGSFRSKLRYDQRFGDGKFGVVLGGSYYNTINGEERYEGIYQFRETGTGNDLETLFLLDELELRPLQNFRERWGANATFDYRFSPSSKIFTKFSLNSLRDQSERYRIRLRARGSFPDKGNPFFVGGEDSDARFRRDVRDQTTRRENATFTFGGQHSFWKSATVDYGYSLSRSERTDDVQAVVFRATGLSFNIDRSDRDFPQFNPIDFDPSDYSQYNFSGYQLTNPRIVYGLIQNVKANFTFPITLNTKINGELKFGGKLRFQENSRTLNSEQYAGYDGFYNLSQVLGEDQGSIFDGRYNMGRFPSPARTLQHFRQNFSLYGFDQPNSFFNSESNTFDAEENVQASYLQGKLDFGRLSTVFGVRYENTDADYSATIIETTAGGGLQAQDGSGTQDYDFWLPSLHLKYELTPRTNLRASYFESFARPNISDVVPRENRNVAELRIDRGNPNLQPAYSRNVDFLIEHFFESEGTISLGVYYKNIEDFIFTQSSIISDDPVFEGYRLNEPINGDVADILGVEFTFAKKFTFLPGWLSGFGFFGNYTFVNSESSISEITTENNQPVLLERDGLPFIGQADHTWNAALYYDSKKFSIRASLNYNDQSPTSYDVRQIANQDRFLVERYQLDANASYKVTDNFTLFIEAQNLTDEPVIEYQAARENVSNYEIYGISARFGLNFKF